MSPCYVYEVDDRHRFTICGGVWGVGGKKVGTLNVLASDFLEDITIHNRDCLIVDTVILLLSLSTMHVWYES